LTSSEIDTYAPKRALIHKVNTRESKQHQLDRWSHDEWPCRIREKQGTSQSFDAIIMDRRRIDYATKVAYLPNEKFEKCFASEASAENFSL